MLAVTGLSKSFRGVPAVRDVSFAVASGESVGLVGPNGAGKTTVFNCIFGQVRPDGGKIELDGRDLVGEPTYRRARSGIGRTYQRLEVFPEMTVRDHLIVAQRAVRGRSHLWRDLANRSAPSASELAHVEEVLALVGIEGIADVPAAALGLGTCRLVELARALAADPRLLLADEPSSGLDLNETQELAGTLRRLQSERGMAILLVEHDLAMVGAVVDRVIVMDLGKVVGMGTFDEVMADPAVRRAYLGAP